MIIDNIQYAVGDTISFYPPHTHPITKEHIYVGIIINEYKKYCIVKLSDDFIVDDVTICKFLVKVDYD